MKLENPGKVPDGAGGEVEIFESFVTTKGYFKKKSGFRDFVEGYDQLVTEYQCWLTWRSEFDNNIRKDTRLIYDNRVFKIVDKEIVDERRHLYRFTLIEVQ